MRMLIDRYGHKTLLLRNKPPLWRAVLSSTRRSNESYTLYEDIIERVVSGRSLSWQDAENERPVLVREELAHQSRR